MSHSAAHTGDGRPDYENWPAKRPASIAELAERARDDGWDESKEFKQHLRTAENCRREGKECAERGDLESAFVELARAATLVLERLPSHRDYSMLSADQRHNLALNGQDILDNLSDIKPTLVDRYERWLQMNRDGADGIDQERMLDAHTQAWAIASASRFSGMGPAPVFRTPILQSPPHRSEPNSSLQTIPMSSAFKRPVQNPSELPTSLMDRMREVQILMLEIHRLESEPSSQTNRTQIQNLQQRITALSDTETLPPSRTAAHATDGRELPPYNLDGSG